MMTARERKAPREAMVVSRESASKAIDALRHAVEIDPRHSDARFWLGKLFLAEGVKTSAREELRILKEIAPQKAAELANLISP